MPANSLLILQELRDKGRTSLLPWPKPRRRFGVECRRVAFAHDGRALAGVFQESFVGFRVVSWDLKEQTVVADHPIADRLIQHPGFHPGAGPRIEWLPDGNAWMLYGQSLIDRQTGKLRGSIPLNEIHWQHLIRVLTRQYVVRCTNEEVRIMPLPQLKKE